MANPTYDPKLTNTLQTTAELIALKDREEQLQWLLFLFSELESFHGKTAFGGFLADLQERIASRLNSGNWPQEEA